MISGDLVHVELGEAMPRNDAVNSWWKANAIGGKYREVIPVAKGEEQKLSELANLIRAIEKAPYKVKAYKYECPRGSAVVLRNVEKILGKVFTD